MIPEKARDTWHFGIPAIAQLAEAPLALDTAVTVIVGENGSGKSTLLEAVAAAWGARLAGAVKHWSPSAGDEDTDLHWALRLDGEHPRPAGGCFLRAEAMHQLFTEVDRGTPHQTFGGALNAQSHGESFLAFLASRDTERGLFILDEPEAALSFSSCLQLMVLMDSLSPTDHSSCWPPIRRCWPPTLARRSWNSARMAAASPRGTT